MVAVSLLLPWIAFVAAVIAFVAVDLWLTGRRHRRMSVGAALGWSAGWIGVALVFGAGLWVVRGHDTALDYYTAWLVEKSLSIDNLFVFLLIFRELKVPPAQQHRVLTWGILGALVLRGVMILVGVRLIALWHPVIYGFGALLVLTGARSMWKSPEHGGTLAEGRLVRLIRRLLPIAPRYDGDRFFTRTDAGERVGTLLLLALLVVEVTDVMFAIDSIPAALAITTDPFVVFTSNILALLGLRTLFLALSGLLDRLRYLHVGLGLILVLAGAKMLLGDLVHVPHVVALAITAGVLVVTVAASLLADRLAATRARHAG